MESGVGVDVECEVGVGCEEVGEGVIVGDSVLLEGIGVEVDIGVDVGLEFGLGVGVGLEFGLGVGEVPKKVAVMMLLPLIVAVVEAEDALPNVTALAGLTLQEAKTKPLSGVADIETC